MTLSVTLGRLLPLTSVMTQVSSIYEIEERIRQHEAELKDRFGVASLAIFGSASRDELSETSDIDVVVRFDRPATIESYLDLKHFLEEVLGRSVDLATEQMIKPRLRQRIQRELIYVS